jgi:hypothetical protein
LLWVISISYYADCAETLCEPLCPELAQGAP